MTASTGQVSVRQSTWKFRQLTLKSGENVNQGAMAFGDPSTGKVIEGVSSASKVFLGVFAESKDATAGDTPVNVDFLTERTVLYRANDGGITNADRFNDCYAVDDNTVSKTSTSRTRVGMIVDVDPITDEVGFILDEPVGG